jgi:replicative DNA helicase
MSDYIDTTAVIQVIGCVLNTPSILDETDKYTITDEDFAQEFHRIVFGSIYNIHSSGNDVTIDSIIDYLSNRPKYDAIFHQNKGPEYLVKISQIATQDTFNYYYNRLKKFTLMRAYDNFGLDMRQFYDPTNVLDTKKKQQQEDWLDNISLAGIAEMIDASIDDIRLRCVDDDGTEGYQAGDDILALIQDLEKHPEVGIPLYGPLINTVTRGARLRKFYLRSAATGVGKAIPNDTIIPTPEGNKRVDEIKPGDYLFGDDGKPTRVLKTHPQTEKKQVYIVEFSDGRTAKCCKDHLWEYQYESHRGYSSRVESVQQIIDRTLKLKNGFKDSSNKGFRFRVKLNEPVEYEEKELPIDPYVFGLMLGDGSFRYRNSNKELIFSSADEELPTSIANIMNWTYRKTSDFNYNYVFFDNNTGKKIWVEDFISMYPELMNVYSQNKFIPEEYMTASIQQRYALLQGLMDTDGSIDKDKGRTSFTSTSKVMIDQVVDLCHSLGFITGIIEDSRSEKYTESCYTVRIQCKKENKVNLFRLSRKVERATKYATSTKRNEHKDYIAITNIYPIEEYSDMTCFTVDNNSHLFLMNDFIVTHNTRTMVADACNFACNEIYEPDFGMWIKNGKSQPTLFIATEQDKSEVQTMMLAFVSAVNEEHILNGQYEDGERDRVIKAAEILKQATLWIEELPDFSLQDIENKIKKGIRDHDVKYVVHDYIHTSLKILSEITRKSGGVRLREDNVLFMLSARLKDIANTYGVFILSGTQLNGSYTDSETPDQNLLRGAKSIADWMVLKI